MTVMKLNLFYLIPLVLLFSCDNENQKNEPTLSYENTYDAIQGEIWDKSCINCHSSGNPFASESDLILTSDVSYNQLINREPKNEAAANDGLVLVGTDGLESLYKSFLWEKINAPNEEHFYNDHPEYGSIMPLGGDFLTMGQLEMIEEWIKAGAPREGEVVDISVLENTDKYERRPFTKLETPESGYQFHIGPFDVKPNDDRELFVYQKLNNESDIFVNRIEITMKPGSHHFILYNFDTNLSSSLFPKEGIIRDLYNEVGSYEPTTLFYMQYHQFIAGTQWPVLDYSFPQGVALRIPANTGFDLNSHYANGSDEVIEGEVYANVHTIEPEEVTHVAEVLNLNNQDIFLPAGEVTTIRKTYIFDKDINIIQLFSHAHRHMVEFRVLKFGGANDGELLYVSYDWEHPPIYTPNKPILFKSGEGVRLEVTYNNDEDRDIIFGLRSTDEMMILFGAYYQ